MGVEAGRMRMPGLASNDMAARLGDRLALKHAVSPVQGWLSAAETPPAGEGEPWLWVDSDFWAADSMGGLEWQYQPFVTPRPSMQPRRRLIAGNKLALAFSRYHEALPYSTAERLVLAEACDEASFMHISGMPDRERQRDYLQGIQATVLSEGVRKVVHGRDLMRRWWSWRRQTDEFTGQGSLDVAREALDEMAKLLR